MFSASRVAPLGLHELPYARALGVDIRGTFEEAKTSERAFQAQALRGVKAHVGGRRGSRAEGHDRGQRIAGCGRLLVAKQGAKVGLAHYNCRDRCCFRCGAKRMQTIGTMLTRWVVQRRNPVLFVTLTQIKLSLEHEDLRAAVKRLLSTWRAVVNTKTKAGRELREMFVGGERFVETTWSRRGDRHGTHVVRESGWHCHIHALVEVAPGVEPGKAAAALVAAWLRENPECSAAGQDIQAIPNPATQAERCEDKIRQACKYPIKPFVTKDVERTIEAATALADIHTRQPFGSWRGWVVKMDKPRDKPPIILSWDNLGSLRRAIDNPRHIQFEHRQGDHTMIYTEHAWIVDLHIRRDPRTFQQRARDAERERKLALERPRLH